MPFLLISRDDDDRLRLLTTGAAASRQDALAELSRLTADPDFDGWDDDVLLLDLDSGLPVLLVRPTANAADPGVIPAEESEPLAAVDEAEVITFVAPSNETEEWRAVAVPASVTGVATEIPPEEADAFAAYVAPVVVDEEPSSVVVLADEPEVVMDGSYPLPPMAAELTEEVDAETASIPIEESIAEESFETLEVPDLVQEEAVAAPASVEAPITEYVDDDESNGLREALERTAVVMAAEAAAASALVHEDAPEAETVEPEDAAVTEPAIETWPWDVAPAASADAPVEEAPVEDADVEDAAVEDAPMEPLGDREAEPAQPSEPAEVPEPAVEPQPQVFGAPGEPSGFLADLEPIPSAGAEGESVAGDPPDVATEPPAEEAVVESDSVEEAVESASVADSAVVADPAVSELVEDSTPSPMDDYVCDDCVYVETCPNKDQRLPKDCVSFQWK